MATTLPVGQTIVFCGLPGCAAAVFGGLSMVLMLRAAA
jgi:hypothetical protein